MKNPPPFASVLESLEPKIAPAGVVNILYNAGTNSMTITGDGENNDFTMTHTTIDTWGFTGNNGTTFKVNGGAPTPSVANMPVTTITKINLGDGNDKMTVTAEPTFNATTVILEGAFEVLGGKGADEVRFQIELSPTFNGLTKFDLGDGYDTLQFAGNTTFANKVLLSAGAGGGDVVMGPFATQTFTKGLTVDLGSGGGRFFTNDLDVSGGKLEIKSTGGLYSLAYLDGELDVDQGVSINLGSAGNEVLFGDFNINESVIGGPLSIVTSGGGDNVTVRGTLKVSGAITVDMKDGANQFTIRENATLQATSVLLKGGKSGLDVDFENNATLVTSTFFTVDVKGTTLDDNTFDLATGDSLRIGSTFNYLGGARNDVLTFGSNADVDIRSSMIVTLGAGANGVNFGNADITIGGNLSLTGLTGNDSVSMSGDLDVLGSILMNLGAGTNYFLNAGGDVRVIGALSYTGGAGNDSVNFGGADLIVGHSLAIAAGDGDNQVEIHAGNGLLSSISYTGGKGQDQVYLGVNAQDDAGSTYLTGGVTAKLGAGLNRLLLVASTVRGAVNVQSLSATAETDFLTLRDATVFGTFTSALGKGVSTLTIDDSTFNNAVNVTTGDGADVLKFDNLAGPEYSSVNRWNSAVKILSGTGDDQFIFGTGNAAPANTNVNIFRGFSSIFDSGTGTDTVQQNGGQTLNGNAYNVPVS